MQEGADAQVPELEVAAGQRLAEDVLVVQGLHQFQPQLERRRPVRAVGGEERNRDGGADRHPYRDAEAQDRIGREPGPARQREAGQQRLRTRLCAAAAEEGAPVGLVFDPAQQSGVGADHMQDDPLAPRRLAVAPRGQQDVALLDILHLEEQPAEGGMRGFGLMEVVDHLEVAGRLQVDGLVAVVRERDAADLEILDRRHGDVRPGGDVAVPSLERHVVRGEQGMVVVRHRLHRLVGVAPEPAVFQIPHVNVAAVVLAGQVRAPAVEHRVVAAAEPLTVRRQHQQVVVVRNHMGGRDGRIDFRYDAGLLLFLLELLLVDADRIPVPRQQHQDERSVLLQQDFGRPDHRLHMEPPLQQPVVQAVVDRGEDHALVVRHETLHQGKILLGGRAGAVEVERLVKAVRARRAEADQLVQVLHRGGRTDVERERRRIRRHHPGRPHAGLQAQVVRAERGILVVRIRVEHEILGFRYAPGDSVLAAVQDLPVDRGRAALGQQGAARGLEDDVGHQVLEHRPAPGDQRRDAADQRQRPAEGEPVLLGHIPLGDRQKARNAGFGSEQVVMPALGHLAGNTVSDVEQPLLGVVQRPEIRGGDLPVDVHANGVDPVEQGRRCRLPRLRQLRQTGGRVQAVRSGQVPHLRLQPVGRRRQPEPPVGVGAGVPGSGAQGGDQQAASLRGVKGPGQRVGTQAGDFQRVPQPGDKPVGVERFSCPFQQSVFQRHQMGQEITAVDGRHEVGRQDLEGLHLVPVVQVPVPFGQALHGPHDRVAIPHRLGQRDEPEIARAERGDQLHADVGGRSLVRQAGSRELLVVVGAQPIVFLRGELLEEPPGPAGRQPKQPLVLRGDPPFGGRAGRLADLPRDPGRGEPEGGQHQQGNHRRRVDHPDCQDAEQDGRHESGRHHADVAGKGGLHVLLDRLGGLPFQQVPVTDQEPEKRPGDGVEGEPGAVRQEDDVEQGLDDNHADGFHQDLEGDPRGGVPAFLPDDVDGQVEQPPGVAEQQERQPQERQMREKRDVGQDGEHARDRGEAAAQVVGHLPAGKPVDWRVAQDPGQQLPVPADPAVVSDRVGRKVGRRAVQQAHPAGERAPRQAALQQVVRQHGVFLDHAAQQAVKDTKVIDALADEDPLVERVLVDVRNDGGIAVDAGLPGEDAGKEAHPGVADPRRDLRLYDCEAAGDPVGVGIDDRLVQRVRHDADQQRRAVADQLGVRVERDHVAERGIHLRRARRHDERHVLLARQHRVEILELAPLAFPAHPAFFPLVPLATAKKQ